MSNITVNSGLYSHDIRAEIIAARDKWWITQMETNFMAAIGCRLFPDNCDSCSIIERCTALSWQRFKLSLQSSVGMTNLMGAFPDLPDVREVGQ